MVMKPKLPKLPKMMKAAPMAKLTASSASKIRMKANKIMGMTVKPDPDSAAGTAT